MLSTAPKILFQLSRQVTVNPVRHHQVTVLGGATEIGQTISLLLRAQPSITRLVIHDTQEKTPGVVMDLSHIPSDTTLIGFSGDQTLDRALKTADLVIIAGGTIRKPGMPKKAWFATNAEFIKRVSSKLARLNPMPFVGVVTEPINTLVPMAAELLRSHGRYDPKKLFGITTVDFLRAQAIYANDHGLNPRNCYVPVIGGHSEKTTIPLLSQAQPACEMTDREIQEFTHKVRRGHESVVIAKKGWSPTQSVAYGVLCFTKGILDALHGRPAKINAYVENNDFGTSFFSGLVDVDYTGANDMQRYCNLSQLECYLLERSIEQIRKDVIKGKKILELA